MHLFSYVQNYIFFITFLHYTNCPLTLCSTCALHLWLLYAVGSYCSCASSAWWKAVSFSFFPLLNYSPPRPLVASQDTPCWTNSPPKPWTTLGSISHKTVGGDWDAFCSAVSLEHDKEQRMPEYTKNKQMDLWVTDKLLSFIALMHQEQSILTSERGSCAAVW